MFSNSFTLVFVLFLSLAFSCKVKKNSITANNKTDTPTDITVQDEKMNVLGFVKATVKDFTKDSGCGFLLVLDESKQILQILKPLDLSFKKNDLNVWIKYRPIRPIVPECRKGITIDLESIKLQ